MRADCKAFRNKEIFIRRAKGEKLESIANDYNISKQMIGKICKQYQELVWKDDSEITDPEWLAIVKEIRERLDKEV